MTGEQALLCGASLLLANFFLSDFFSNKAMGQLFFEQSHICSDDMWQGSCISILFTKLLGYLVIIMAAINKIPQLNSIIRNQSVKGLAFWGFWNESFMFCFSLGYYIHKKYTLDLFGERIILLSCNIIILCCFIAFDNQFDQQKFYIWIGVVGLFALPLCLDFTPPMLFTLSQIIQTYFIISSKIPQIMMNYRNKNTGQLSFLSSFLAYAQLSARFYTVFLNISDFLILFNYTIGIILSGIVVIQILVYKKNNIIEQEVQEEQKESNTPSEIYSIKSIRSSRVEGSIEEFIPDRQSDYVEDDEVDDEFNDNEDNITSNISLSDNEHKLFIIGKKANEEEQLIGDDPILHESKQITDKNSNSLSIYSKKVSTHDESLHQIQTQDTLNNLDKKTDFSYEIDQSFDKKSKSSNTNKSDKDVSK